MLQSSVTRAHSNTSVVLPVASSLSVAAALAGPRISIAHSKATKQASMAGKKEIVEDVVVVGFGRS